ncbi:hypothetical protein HanIR_Chr04g0186331 [Helianthus annuus]|nr:hypothetical protein HanIR_Chr04g0186331 [Helianthus annuus]
MDAFSPIVSKTLTGIFNFSTFILSSAIWVEFPNLPTNKIVGGKQVRIIPLCYLQLPHNSNKWVRWWYEFG